MPLASRPSARKRAMASGASVSSGREDFQGHAASADGLLRLVDRPHAAATQPTQDAVAAHHRGRRQRPVSLTRGRRRPHRGNPCGGPVRLRCDGGCLDDERRGQPARVQVGEASQEVLRLRLLPPEPAVVRLQEDEFAQQDGALRRGDGRQIFLDAGVGAGSIRGLPGGLEAVAHFIQPPRQRGIACRGRVAHEETSPPHRPRISRSLRSTVRGTQPSFAAISSLA